MVMIAIEEISFPLLRYELHMIAPYDRCLNVVHASLVEASISTSHIHHANYCRPCTISHSHRSIGKCASNKYSTEINDNCH